MIMILIILLMEFLRVKYLIMMLVSRVRLMTKLEDVEDVEIVMMETEDVEVVVMETEDVDDVVVIAVVVVVMVINFNYFLISSFGMHFINENVKWILF